jgi:hypothetical protein
MCARSTGQMRACEERYGAGIEAGAGQTPNILGVLAAWLLSVWRLDLRGGTCTHKST